MPNPSITLAALRARHRKEEVRAIRDAMRQCGGNLSRAAEVLGLKRTTLHDLVHGRYAADLADEASDRVGRPATEES